MFIIAGLMLAACEGSGSASPGGPRLVAKSVGALGAGATPQAVGRDCSVHRRFDCESNVCIHIKPSPNTGYFCSLMCAATDDCPVDWTCQPMIPGNTTSLICVPPDWWAGQAAVMRATTGATDGGAP